MPEEQELVADDWHDKLVDEPTKIARIEVYFMKEDGEVWGIAFSDKEGNELLFQSKILRQNWAKEDHDAVKVIDVEGPLTGLKCLQGTEPGNLFNLQFKL